MVTALIKLSNRKHFHVTCTPPTSMNKSGFETQRRRHQKSETGVSVAPQKGLMSSKKEKKKKINLEMCMISDGYLDNFYIDN